MSRHRIANRAKANRVRAGTRHRRDVSGWLGVSALTLGLGAAMANGSALAHADTSTGSTPGATTGSSTSTSDTKSGPAPSTAALTTTGAIPKTSPPASTTTQPAPNRIGSLARLPVTLLSHPTGTPAPTSHTTSSPAPFATASTTSSPSRITSTLAAASGLPALNPATRPLTLPAGLSTAAPLSAPSTPAPAIVTAPAVPMVSAHGTPAISTPVITPPTATPTLTQTLTKTVVNVLFGLGGMNPNSPQPENLVQDLLFALARDVDAPPVTGATAVTTPTLTTGATTSLLVPTVQNSLTYTPPPNLIDEITEFIQKTAGQVLGLFGLNFSGLVGSLMQSEDPPFFLTLGLTAQQTQDEISPGNVWKVWELQPPNPTGKAVVAIHGGGFILQPSLLQWIDYTDMARATGATVIVPLYPLSTTAAGSAINVEPVMADFISQQIAQYGADNVSVYADSSGATWAMGAVRELILRGDAVPASMVLLSPAADSSLTNPDIKTIDDPIFDINNLNFYSNDSHEFDGIANRQDPRVSPLFMETAVLQALPPTTIYVGQREILEPDNLLLYQRAVDIGAPISMVVGTGLPHDWPLTDLPIYSQTPVVRPDIYRELGLIP